MAVGFYVAKYVNKKSDMDLAAKGLGAKEWNNSLKTKLSLLPKKLFRIRMSRNFGMKMLTMTNLSTECLIQRTKLGYDATPFNQIVKQNAKREMRLRLRKVTVADVFFFNDTATTEIYTLSLHDALPICFGEWAYGTSAGCGSGSETSPTCGPSPESHGRARSEEHTSELQSPCNLVCRLLLEKKKKTLIPDYFTFGSVLVGHSLTFNTLKA